MDEKSETDLLFSVMLDIESLGRVPTLLEDHFWHSCDFTCSSSGKEVGNISANQRPEHPCWISNRFQQIQVFRAPRGTIVISLVT